MSLDGICAAKHCLDVSLCSEEGDEKLRLHHVLVDEWLLSFVAQQADRRLLFAARRHTLMLGCLAVGAILDRSLIVGVIIDSLRLGEVLLQVREDFFLNKFEAPVIELSDELLQQVIIVSS